MDEFIQELIEDLGAKSYKKGVDWNGYEVFIPQYKGNPCIGLPYVVLKKGAEARICTPDESLAYLAYEQNKELGKESTESLKEKSVVELKDDE